jgi:hypothetical protein
VGLEKSCPSASLHTPEMNTAASAHELTPIEIGTTSSTSLDSTAQMPSPTTPAANIQPTEFENVMRPITLSMKMESPYGHRTSNSTTTTLIGRADSTVCSCERALDAMNCNFPLRRHADTLVTLYFGRLNRIYPLLDEDTFTAQWRSLWQSGPRSHTRGMHCVGFCRQTSKGRLFPVLVNLVLALGSLFASPDIDANVARAAPFFNQAEEVNIFKLMSGEIGIEFVQVGLLMGIYLQSTEQYSKCWNVVGLVIRMAQNLGLHYDTAGSRKLDLSRLETSVEDAELRRLLWNGCILLDTDISLSFRQPLMISTDEVGSNACRKSINPDPQQPSLLEYFHEKIKLYGILRKFHAIDNSTRNTNIEERLRGLVNHDNDLMDWKTSLHACLSFDALETNPSLTFKHQSPPASAVLDFPALTKRLYTRYAGTVVMATGLIFAGTFKSED